jgi:NADH-ubiquinone oxidoreductase chain 5
MYLFVIFLSLNSAFVCSFLGCIIGSTGSRYFSTFSIFLTFLISTFIFFEVGFSGSICCLYFLKWFSSELLNVNFGFLFDSLTVIMLVVISSVSTLVHLYSCEYMSHDPHIPRFMSYLSLFTFFMLVLVTADNFLQMFVGWEGVGLCSYLLINFWFTRLQANKAAIKAMIVNRVGDFGLVLGILCIFNYFCAADYASVFALTHYFSKTYITFICFNINLITIVCLLLFVGAVGKSAQIGLHVWLPDAMEGPTPVSALIHAATMVTAGVFLIARCSPLFEYSTDALFIVTFFGACTSFLAATTGLLQNDLKRVIAYSTCSQLGYMVFACGLSNYSVGIFHLANHAFFKALLFLGAGVVIHAVQDEQDFRKMGGLAKIIPFTYGLMFIGSLSLMGFPFLSGFYSKDVILEVAFAKFTISGHFAYWLGSLSAFFTAFYSIRLLFLTFLTNTNGFRPVILGAHDGELKLVLPLAILAIPSIFFGFITRDMVIGFGTSFWGNAIFILPENSNLIESEFIPIFFKILPLILSLLGAACSFLLYSNFSFNLFSIKMTFVGNLIYSFLNKKWWFDKFYNEFLIQNIINFGYHISYKSIDRGIIEILGPFGVSNLIFSLAFNLNKLHTGYIYHYVIYMIFNLIFIVILIFLVQFFIFDIRLLILFLTFFI